jgi:hypothetical protein
MGDVVLLGAGASADAKLPTAFGMTEAIAESIYASARAIRNLGDGASEDVVLADTLRYVCQVLRHYDAVRGARTLALDVERVFAAVELLSERKALEVTPFVESWQRGADDRDGLSEPIYPALMRRMLDELRRQLDVTGADVSYLEPAIVAATKWDVRIATLNYDRTVEVAGDTAGVRIGTGIHHWVHTGHWSWGASEIPLLKLHGSIDWAWQDDLPSPGRLPSRFIEETPRPARESRPPVLVFGLRGKLRAEGPFIAALAEFESWLASAQRLIVVGYSFRDDHVNQIVRRWTYERRQQELVIVDPAIPAAIPTKASARTFRELLLAYLARGKRNDVASTRLRVIRRPAARAMLEVF